MAAERAGPPPRIPDAIAELSLVGVRSREAAAQKIHWEYQHEVKLEAVKATPDRPDSGQVTVQVREVAKQFKGGKLDRAGSRDEVLRVRYDAVRQDGRWHLRDVKVLR